MNRQDMRELVETSLRKLESWVEGHQYRGYEPFDGLESYLRPLTCGSLLGDRILLQLVRQSPWNLRPILGVRPQQSTKGRGYMAWGYLAMLKVTGDLSYATRAVGCLEWLIENRSACDNLSWGNHFEFATRAGRIPRLEPIVPWTSLIGQTLLDAHEYLGEKRFLDWAVDACQWILTVPRRPKDTGLCLGYNALGGACVHGASMLGAALIARTSKLAGRDLGLRVAKDAMRFSCSRQNSDGSWYYAEQEDCLWIDSFHTAYNLDSLKCYIDSTGDRQFDDNLERGLAFFKANFFDAEGRPKYYHDRAYPIDIQCASQAIDTLAYFSRHEPSCLELSQRVARWTIEHMQDDDGHFYYRRLPLMTVRTPMLHWGQATMYRGLANLLLAMSADDL